MVTRTRRAPGYASRMDDLFASPPPLATDGIRVGIGGWTFAPWRKNFYPDGLVQRRELEYASRQLTAIEINGTYYSAQKPATYASWRDQTPDGFVFSAKAPKRIMQSRSLASTRAQVEDFVGGIAELITALISFYAASAVVLNTHFGKPFLPMGKPFGIFK